MSAVRECVRSGVTIGFGPPEFLGRQGDYEYRFEGEDDLLHLIVTRTDEGRLTPEEGQSVASYVLEGVPPGMVWIKPGEYSQHFYFGHELLLAIPEPESETVS